MIKKYAIKTAAGVVLSYGLKLGAEFALKYYAGKKAHEAVKKIPVNTIAIGSAVVASTAIVAGVMIKKISK
ncbi:MAG: hypothetical protein HUJ51_01400 [Eggerthellaceae bacterium]|nr:hypothetical protein [Eggerthellaceae bacterium]